MNTDFSHFYTVFSYVIVGILGLILGSFYNVVIYRVPNELKIYEPARSFCPTCKTPIRWYDNIPVFSYVFLLRGKCRHCKEHISFRYTVVEILTCVLFLAVWWRFFDINNLSSIYTAVVYLILVSIGIIMAFIDWEHLIAYDIMSFSIFVCGLLLCLAPEETTHVEMTQRILGALFSLAFWGLYAVIPSMIKKRETTGSADVIVFMFCGFVVGLQGALLMVLTSWIFFFATFLLRSWLRKRKAKKISVLPETEEERMARESEEHSIPLLPGGMISFFLAIMLAPELASLYREFLYLITFTFS